MRTTSPSTLTSTTAVSSFGTFSGFYDYSVDSEGKPTAAPTGRIIGGSREFKGATGSFTVLDFHYTSNDPVKQAGRWKGSIRY